MSDYLTRLVERTLGLAEVALPVIPPMFAPDAAVGAAVRDGPLQPEPLAEDQTTWVAKGRTTPSSTPVLSSNPGGDGADGVAPPTPADQHARPASIFGEVAPEPDGIEVPALLDKARRANLETGTKDFPASPVLGVERVMASKAQLVDHVPPAIPAATRVAAQVGRVATIPATRAARSVPSAGPNDVAGPERATTPMIAKQAAASEDGASRPTGSRPPARTGREDDRSSAPVVRITVGRIEVRAVQPVATPPARRPPAPTPRLSLDEYLRAEHGSRS